MKLITNLVVLLSIILVGYFAKRKGILPSQSASVMVPLVLHITLPALILVSMNLPYGVKLAMDTMAIALLAILFTLLMIVLSKWITHFLTMPELDKRQWRFALIFGNVTFIGYPLAYLILGQEGIFLSAIFDFIQSFFMFTYGIHHLAGETVSVSSWRKMVREPVIVALTLGIVMFFMNVSWPAPVMTVLDKIGSTTTVLSMLVVGLLLEFQGLKSKKTIVRQGLLVLWKLFIIPSIFLLVAPWLRLSSSVFIVSVVMISMPTAILSTVLSEKFAGDGQFAAGSVFLTHLLCLLSLPLILFMAGVI